MNEFTPHTGEHQHLLTAFKSILDFYYGEVSYDTLFNVLGSKHINLDDLQRNAKDFGRECDAIA